MKRILYTSADAGLPWWPRTRPYLEAYAARVNAELVILPKTERPGRTWVLFDAMADCLRRRRNSSAPEQYAWMDADIIIAPDAPDIFNLPDKLFVAPPDPPARVHPRWRAEHFTHGVWNCRPYPITALVKWNAQHALNILSWMEKRPSPAHWGDQEVLALACYELELAFAYMPQSWHAMSRHLTPQTKFLHAAGKGKAAKLDACLRHLARQAKEN